MKSDGGNLLGAVPKPRKNARLKTTNLFPLNKTTLKNRAKMRGFYEGSPC
jgi:hypothetical protein